MKTRQRSGFRGVWPVVQRELREGARRPVNHWLRLGSAAGGMIVFYIVTRDPRLPPSVIGIELFASIHTLLLLLICCLVPAMTADCIARERRDGTLGLLFLTPLTAGGIVVGKGAIQSLLTLTLWLAVLPVLVVPVLMGGVSWIDGVTAITIEVCATVLCLAAGLLASSLAKGGTSAFVLAPIFGCALVAIFIEWMMHNIGSNAWGAFPVLTGLAFWDNVGFLPEMQAGVWSDILSAPGMRTVWLSTLAESAALALLIFIVVIKFAAHRIEISWQDKPPSLQQEKLEKQYCTPILERWFARSTRRTMDWNPVAWLQQYSWKARVSKWGLCLACVVVETCISTSYLNLPGRTSWLGLPLVGLIIVFTFIAVSGFLREKETGALELILITPLSANRIIGGRVWGLWKQVLPALLVCGGAYFFTMSWTQNSDENGATLGLVVGVFLGLPFFATYFALGVKNVIVAVILTWLALLLAAVAGGLLLRWFTYFPYANDPVSFWKYFGCVSVIYALLALPFYFRLQHNLSRRNYSY